jgi:hypothetical protein
MRTALALSLLALALGAPARGDDLAARAARSYALAPLAPAVLALGEPGTVAVAIRCAPGVHVQRQAPLRVTAAASPGVVLGKTRLGWGDVRETGDAQEVEVRVSLKATAAGEAEVRLHLDFFVCSKEWCVRQERELAVRVAVGGAAGAAGPAAGRQQPGVEAAP